MLGLAGCGRIIDWGTNIFEQAESLDDVASTAQPYLKSVTVYDQFTTVAMFDALWLSDDVRMIYAKLYADRRGKDEEYKKTFLRRQLEENKHFIVFYVLCPFEALLADSQSPWSIFLKVDDRTYYPTELKVVELDPEYKAIFGKKLSRFKESYVLKFDARDVEDKKIIDNQTRQLKLYFKSVDKQTYLMWDFTTLGIFGNSMQENDVIETNKQESKSQEIN